MKQVGKANGYSLKFHPTQPLAFALPNSSEVSVVSTIDWKPIAKLTKLKFPRELCFTDDAIVVSGIEGHIGIYEQDTFACRVFFKDPKAKNDNSGLFVHAASNRLGVTAHFDGVYWIDYMTKEACCRFRPTDELGFGPATRYIHAGPTSEQLITLCTHSLLQKGDSVRRSVAYIWSVEQENPSRKFDVLPKPSKQEYATQCCLGIDNVLLVSTIWGNRLLGWDIDSGTLVCDNPKLTHGGESCNIVWAVLPKRRLIAVGSNGYIDFWNSDLTKVVHQFDSGKRQGYEGELTVSPDEHFIACSNGRISVYEIPAELQGP